MTRELLERIEVLESRGQEPKKIRWRRTEAGRYVAKASAPHPKTGRATVFDLEVSKIPTGWLATITSSRGNEDYFEEWAENTRREATEWVATHLQSLRGLKEESYRYTGGNYKALIQSYLDNPTYYDSELLQDEGWELLKAESPKFSAYSSKRDLTRMLAAELRRIRENSIPLTMDGLRQYLRVSRKGSKYPLSGKMRMGVFMVLVAENVPYKPEKKRRR